MKKTLLSVLILAAGFASAQVGINTSNPKATLEVVAKNTPSVYDGLIAPKLSGDQLSQKNYTNEQSGAIVYVTSAASNLQGQVVDVDKAGYYYFDGTKWKTIGGSAVAPTATTNQLSSNVNSMTSNVNNVSSSANIINNNTLSSSANTITSNVNNVSSNTSIINTNSLSSNVNTMSSVVNGVSASADIIKTNNITTTGNNISTSVNGITSTAAIVPNLYTANGEISGNRTVSLTSGTNTVTFTRTAAVGSNDTPVLSTNGSVQTIALRLDSDARLKENIKPINGDLALSLNPVTYTWNKAGKDKGGNNLLQYGFIAQEVEKIMPDAVYTDKDGYKSVNYIEVIPVLAQKIKDQDQVIKKLIERVEKLENNKK